MTLVSKALKSIVAAGAAFARNQEGRFMVFLGLALIPMMGTAALGVDLSRAYLAKTRLQNAIDAAAIAMASSSGTDAEIIEMGERFFFANYPPGFFAPATGAPTITVDRLPNGRPAGFNITANATVPTILFPVLGDVIGGASSEFNIGAGSQAVTAKRGLEIVMVLDVTGSMYYYYAGSQRRIEAMRAAAKQMLEILFENDPTPELLRVSVVPYNVVVNIGVANCNYVTGTGLDEDCLPTTPNPFGSTTWAGCVQARHNLDYAGGPYEHDDDDTYIPGATDGTGEWTAFRWPIEPNRRSTGSTVTSSACVNRGSTSTGDYNSYNDPDYSVLYDLSTSGPNKSCPDPILPLTNVRSSVDTYLDNLTVVDGAGTITATGMSWALRVLSQGAPFTEGAAYGDQDWDKAIIVLTDGQQVNSSQGSNCDNATHYTVPPPLQPPTHLPWQFDPDDPALEPDLNYRLGGTQLNGGPFFQWSAYGYVHPSDSDPLGAPPVAPVTHPHPAGDPLLFANSITGRLEYRMFQICQAIKQIQDPVASAPAIEIFAITFGDHITVGDSISNLMGACTTDLTGDNYFHAPDQAELESAFEEIAKKLTSLRLKG